MAKRTLSWDVNLANGKLTCKELGAGQTKVFDLNEFYTHIEWEEIDNLEHEALAYAVQQKLSDYISGKGAKAGYSAREMFSLMENKFSLMCEARAWSEKGERTTPQKRLDALKAEGVVLSEMELAILAKLGLKA